MAGFPREGSVEHRRWSSLWDKLLQIRFLKCAIMKGVPMTQGKRKISEFRVYYSISRRNCSRLEEIFKKKRSIASFQANAPLERSMHKRVIPPHPSTQKLPLKEILSSGHIIPPLQTSPIHPSQEVFGHVRGSRTLAWTSLCRTA